MYKTITALLLLLGLQSAATDSAYVRSITDTLASKYFLGRGYVEDGMQKAAQFIGGQMKELGLEVSTQQLKFPVNTFPKQVELKINGVALKPGIDFLVSADSRSVKAVCDLQQQDSITFINESKKIVVQLVDKLTWTVSQQQANYTTFYLLKSVLQLPQYLSCNVDAVFKKSFACTNVMGSIKGTIYPDSFLVFTAHYDHLGAMGSEAWFPGANDNAGGVALMLAMAKKFKQNPPLCTVIFIAFAAEEAGLVGSEYFVKHPLIQLSAIRFLLNLDLMANGEEGITVVNATEFPAQFALLQKINTDKQLLVTVNSRGKAANSDHYWFTERGVPSFFIYTLGKRKAYHDVYDIASTVPWYEINDLETLLYDFSQIIMN